MPRGDVDGLAAMLAAMEGQEVRVREAAREGVNDALHHVEAIMKGLLGLTSHPPGTPTPSPPGSPPSLVTGRLRRSVQVNGPRREGDDQWVAEVGPTAHYAMYQELGTSRLPARPFIAPAYAQAAPEIRNIIVGALRRALN